jgi:hypothetical protein
MMNLRICKNFIFFIMAFVCQVKAAEVCKIDFGNYKLQAPVDCVKCQTDIKIPSDKVESTVNPLINFVTGSKEQQELIRKFKVMDHFLSSKENAKRCSNFKDLSQNFSKEFQSYVTSCEKGPEVIDRKKVICEWVLPKYSEKVTDSFYAHWTTYGPDKKIKLKPGKYKEDLEPAIRAHEYWCRQVEKNYKNKILLNCTDVKDWVKEFDLVKRVSASVRRDMEVQNDPKNSEEIRKKIFQERCAYFEKNPATTFTSSLYLSCLTQ